MEDDNNLNNMDEKKNMKNGSDAKNMDFDAKDGVFSGFPAKRSIAERRGFNSNAARINTARFRIATSPFPSLSPSPSSYSSAGRSPCITIPPGISPTALLDSPIMLPNSQAMPSPTTGSFHWISSLPLDEGNLNDAPYSCLKFKNNATLSDPNPLPPYSVSLNQVSSNWNLTKGGVLPPIDFAFPADFSKGQNTKIIESRSFNDVKMVNCSLANVNKVEMMQMSRSDEAGDESTLPKNITLGEEDIGRQPVLEKDQKETMLATGAVRTSEDGYNWRKYGQKQVKGSEYPRSYYKCTQPNCQVKKKVERSHDGQITEIIYKGTHNHAKPHLSRRASGLSGDEISDMGEAGENYVKVEGPGWENVQPGSKDIKHGLDWKADGLERTSSTSVVTELSDPISTNKGKPLCVFEAEDTPEHSSTLASHDGDEDGTTQALAPVEDDAEDDESDSKRRKKENYLVESTLPSRAVREPRVVVQIETEVDILDDGYRWRKYGQKVVKGNPNPRSYYKCTTAGCPVRKHVERASHNTKYVITTYDGKHNHEVPTARNNNHISSNDGGLPPSGPNGQSALALPGSAVIPKSENHQTLTSHFDRKPEFGSDFLRPSLVGAFGNNLKFGSSPMCQMKYPSLSSTMPYSSFGLNTDRCTAPQAGSIPSVYPEFPMPLPLNLPSSGNFSLTGLNFNCAKPINPVQPFLSGQQVKDIDTGFLRPKQEQKDDTIYGTCLPPVDHGNSSTSAPSSIYQQVMQNFPS